MALKIGFVKAKIGAVVCFLPATAIDDTEFEKIGFGEVWTTEFKKMRNWKFHRKFFAMLNIVFENMDHEVREKRNVHTVDGLLIDLKILLGHYDLWVSLEGNAVYIPKSISFAAMDQIEFHAFYKHALDVIFAHHLPMEPHALEYAVVRMIGFEI